MKKSRKHGTTASQAQFKEAFNRLKTNIEFLTVEKENKVIAITSSVMGEGKSTISANTAVAMAGKDTKVLLIDGDLRRPMVHKLFNVSNQKGLTNTLQNNEWDTYIIETPVQGLDILTAGSKPPNPVSFLNSPKMEAFLEITKKVYDIIIIDIPPVLIVSDALVISKYVDSLLLVVRSERSTIPEIMRTKSELEKIKAPLAGVVFNDYAPKTGGIYKYGYSNGYHYHYHYGYEEHEQSKVKEDQNKRIKQKIG